MIELAKPSREEFDISVKENYQRSIDEWNQFYASKINNEMLEEGDYPTQDALLLIQQWHWNDPKGWFEFIKSIWWSADWGWDEKEVPHQYRENTTVYQYDISTGGWSGNESIIRAMESNKMMWNLNWVQSRRGGHYIFELNEIKDERTGS